MLKDEETLGSNVISGVVLFGIAVGVGYMAWTHEPAEKDPCQDLREYFAEAHDTKKISDALGVPAHVVVVDTPGEEFPCGLEFEKP